MGFLCELNMTQSTLVIQAYRKSIEERYSYNNIKQFSVLDHLPKEKIEELKHFFLEQVYPPFEKREKRDKSLEALLGILKSPLKILSLGKLLFKSIGTLGRNFNQALGGAKKTISVYFSSIEIEKEMEKYSLSLGYTTKENFNIEKVLCEVPEKKLRKFHKNIFSLFAYLANENLLKKTIQIMLESQKILAQYKKLYSQREREGLAYGIQTLQKGFSLFQTLSPQEVENILEGIQLIEESWYENILKNQTP